MRRESGSYDLILAKWPNPRADVSEDATDPVDWVIELTTQCPQLPSNELGIAPRATRLRAVMPRTRLPLR